MKMWITFLKRNLVWILLYAIFILLQTLGFYLVHVPKADMIYFMILDFVIFLLFGSIEFWKYCRRAHGLERLKQEAVSTQIRFPEANDAIEECYQEIVENINIHQKLVIGECERQQTDMQEYYSMWVHQIKTPIAALRLLLQVENAKLENDEIEQGTFEQNEQQERYHLQTMQFVADMEDEIFRIEEYVGMALQYQRVHSNSNDLVLKKIELDSVVRETIRKYAKIMIRKKIPIHYEGTKLSTVSDSKWLGFVLEQIISNAIKYTKEGAITIDYVEEGTNLFLRVKDQGIGIREEDLPRVFEKGYTGYNGHANKYSTGIGLYLSKQMLEKLGHTIRIESEIGEGTTVWIGFSQKG